MRIEIVKDGTVCRSIQHEGKTYVQVPPQGEYILRLHNEHWKTRLAVLSVDGVNVLNGEDAGVDGPGYIIPPGGTVDIPGFRRDNGNVAAFTFKNVEESYAALTRLDTSNVGVIGMAVFDFDTPQLPVMPPVKAYPWAPHRGSEFTWAVQGSTLGHSVTASSGLPPTKSFGGGTTRGAVAAGIPSPTKDVGTGYGKQVAFHTKDASFRRAPGGPAELVALYYATRERLLAWGIPLHEVRTAPNPFPASHASVPAPPGWQG